MKRSGKILKITAVTAAVLLLCVLADVWISYHVLVVRHFSMQTEAAGPVRLVVLADLHDSTFGEKNERLARRVLQENPDAVLLAGDFLNADSPDASVPCALIEALDGVPVYFSLGNHEVDYMHNGHPELVDQLEAAGAVVLEEEYVDFSVNGVPLRLGGMYGYAFGLDAYNSACKAPPATKAFLEDFQDTENFKIMMAHRPDSFIFGDASSYWDVDLVVSGHDHGGQVVLPFAGGLYGGDQGWFPEYIHGMYEKDRMHIFITSGLGSHVQKLPRFHNPPEIAVLELIPAE